jgi:hypothetical protein
VKSPIAETGPRFTGFSPFVPSIDAHGRVAFQASLAGSRGRSGIFREADGEIVELASTGDRVHEFVSHPDVAADGSWCAYAVLASGAHALVLGAEGRVTTVAEGVCVGPLGPTSNERGSIAFRGRTPTGEPSIARTDGSSVVHVADTRRFAAFHGLPLIDERGRVVFRADLRDGTQGIYADDGAVLVDTTDELATIGAFPCMNAHGVVAFSATRKDGVAGVFTVCEGRITTVALGGFASFRGALIDDEGEVVFFATSAPGATDAKGASREAPRAGSLGVYAADGTRLLAIGDAAAGSRVVDFALDPVSINGRGELACRVALASGRETIVRLR